MDQGSTYVCLFLAFGLFVLLINWCNTKELQRLKQEFGHEARKEVPEFWWKKAVIYKLHVPTFSDSDQDGVGDIKGRWADVVIVAFVVVMLLLMLCFG